MCVITIKYFRNDTIKDACIKTIEMVCMTQWKRCAEIQSKTPASTQSKTPASVQSKRCASKSSKRYASTQCRRCTGSHDGKAFFESRTREWRASCSCFSSLPTTAVCSSILTMYHIKIVRSLFLLCIRFGTRSGFGLDPREHQSQQHLTVNALTIFSLLTPLWCEDKSQLHARLPSQAR